jgi:hypothetical protein
MNFKNQRNLKNHYKIPLPPGQRPYGPAAIPLCLSMTGKGLPKREANISSPAFAGGRGRFSEGYVYSINLKIKCQYQLKFLTSWLPYKNNMNHFHGSSLPAACLPKPWRRQKALAQAGVPSRAWGIMDFLVKVKLSKRGRFYFLSWSRK